jgi:serine/threonine protein phosphatase 1
MALRLPFLHRPADRLTAAGRTRRPRVVLPDTRPIVYAIGDVHGCLDLLLKIEARIRSDADQHRDREKVIILIGDVIDRGMQSAEIIEHLTIEAGRGFSRFVLAGNHEAAMLAFLDDPIGAPEWLDIGGLQTLISYGISVDPQRRGRSERRRLAGAMAGAVPDEHIGFLRSLPVSLQWGRYLFVHAGIRPGIALQDQSDSDMQEIRKEFTASAADHGFTVVHGHTPRPEPSRLANRISLDVAPYATGRLAAARFDGDDVKFLVVGQGVAESAESVNVPQ